MLDKILGNFINAVAILLAPLIAKSTSDIWIGIAGVVLIVANVGLFFYLINRKSKSPYDFIRGRWACHWEHNLEESDNFHHDDFINFREINGNHVRGYAEDIEGDYIYECYVTEGIIAGDCDTISTFAFTYVPDRKNHKRFPGVGILKIKTDKKTMEGEWSGIWTNGRIDKGRVIFKKV